MPAINGYRIDNMCRTDDILMNLEIQRKEEIAQRRKVRIQQVRLQSKDIANKVLRDIRNERHRQSQLNKTKENDVFKEWQERKISEVNLLYKENIDRIGEAYRNAEKEPDPEKEIEERSLKLAAVAKDRAKKAMDQIRRDQKKGKLNQETCVARREKVRKVENMRSALISSLPSVVNNGNVIQELTDLEEKTDERSRNKKEEMLDDAVAHSRLQPNISDICLGISDLQTAKISAKTSSNSSQNHRHPIAFTVDFYDRNNPCTFTKRPPNTFRAEKVSSDKWRNAAEAAADEEKNEMDRKEKKEREQKAAEERGKKALAKELIRRDFDQLMNRLDGLSKKERLMRGFVEPHLPVDMHMNEIRCAAKAEKKQRNLDSVFEGILFSNEETEKVSETTPIEKVTVPEGCFHTLSETPPEILNVGLESRDITHLSLGSTVDEENPSIENISLKETFSSPSPALLSKEDIPKAGNEDNQFKEDTEKDVPMTLPSRVNPSSRLEDVQDSVQGIQDKITDKDGHCPSDDKQELKSRKEESIQSKDLSNNDENSSEMEKNLSLHREESEPSNCSSQDTSVNIKELRVVLKFDESSSPSSEVSELSTSAASAQKIEKKIIVWKKHCKMTSNEEMKTIIDLGHPSVSERKHEQSAKLLSVGDAQKQRRRRKSYKKDSCTTEKSIRVSPIKSRDPISPSLEDFSSEQRAKALLKEVRAQRREIERMRASLGRPKTPLLSSYVGKLLTMSRESVEALSVSDVSTPSIHFNAQMPVEEEIQERCEVEKVDKATSPVPYPVLPVGEIVSLESTPKKLTSSSSSSTDISIASSSDSSHDAAQIAVPSHQMSQSVYHELSFTQHSPLTPPPSPEYEQLADLHSQRIQDLSTQLKNVRELQKKILSLNSSPESEKSSSSTVSDNSEDSEKSSSSVHSAISNESFKVDEVGRNWDFTDVNLSAKEIFEDISPPKDSFLDLQKVLRPLQEVSSLRRKSLTKSGPPPTPFKGLKWSDFDQQIPHELSTISEVDSKLVSSLSVQESRKENDLHTSVFGAKKTTSIETSSKPDQSAEKTIQEIQETSDTVCSEEIVDLLESWKATSLHDKSFEPIRESDAKTSEETSISPKSSDDSQLSQNLDNVLRMLGISPTIFKPPESPVENIMQESSLKEQPSLPIHSNSKTNTLEKNIKMQKDEQVLEVGKEVHHTSDSFGKSVLDLSSHFLLHSTPLHTSSSSSSSSFSKQKNTSRFPFFGDSAPSSISSSGTPLSGKLGDIDLSNVAPKDD